MHQWQMVVAEPLDSISSKALLRGVCHCRKILDVLLRKLN